MADANRNGVVESAAALRELIRRNIDDIETRGELPAELVEAMSSGGLFRLFLPLDAGGPEATPREAFEVCENLARADGSAAWCASISSAISSYLAWLAPDVLTTIATPLDELRLSGSARPLGVATACRGGYRVTGRWDFASNISQATWYVGTCVIPAESVERSIPKTRAFLIPVRDGVVIPTWQALGMRGTASHDFAVDDLFVPENFVGKQRHLLARPGRAFHPRLARVVLWSPTAGVGMGLARGALEDFALLASERTTSSTVPLRDRPEIQLEYGRAEAITAGARAACLSAIDTAWEAFADPDNVPADLDRILAYARLAITSALTEAVRAIDILLRAAGTAGVFRTAGLERRFRDVHVAAQHAAGQDLHIRDAGRVLLGIHTGVPYV